MISKKGRLRYLMSLLVLTLFLFSMPIQVSAAISIDKLKEQATLPTVAYYEINRGAAEQSEETLHMFNKLSELSHQEIEHELRSKLNAIIQRIEHGESLIWDEEFVEEEVQQYFPDLYPEILKQLEQQTTDSTIEIAPDEVSTSGSKTEQVSVAGKHWTGYEIFVYYCLFTWHCSGEVITGVEYDAWGEPTDPSWFWMENVVDHDYDIDPGTYYIYVKGHFRNFAYQNRYPWHELYLHWIESYDHYSGIDTSGP